MLGAPWNAWPSSSSKVLFCWCDFSVFSESYVTDKTAGSIAFTFSILRTRNASYNWAIAQHKHSKTEASSRRLLGYSEVPSREQYNRGSRYQVLLSTISPRCPLTTRQWTRIMEDTDPRLPLFDAFVLASFHYRFYSWPNSIYIPYIETDGSIFHTLFSHPRPSCFLLPFSKLPTSPADTFTIIRQPFSLSFFQHASAFKTSWFQVYLKLLLFTLHRF